VVVDDVVWQAWVGSIEVVWMDWCAAPGWDARTKPPPWTRLARSSCSRLSNEHRLCLVVAATAPERVDQGWVGKVVDLVRRLKVVDLMLVAWIVAWISLGWEKGASLSVGEVSQRLGLGQYRVVAYLRAAIAGRCWSASVPSAPPCSPFGS
jgi:hypothetical protein